MNPIESLLVDNKPINLGTFAVPDMSLSSSRTTMTQHSFEVKAKAAALLSLLEPAYAAWVTESRQDDELCGEPQDELAKAGYPDLQQLINEPQLLELVLGHYLLHEFLGKFTWDGSEPIEYWLDSVTKCNADGEFIYLHGFCYSR
jgi:hypothetical protein